MLSNVTGLTRVIYQSVYYRASNSAQEAIRRRIQGLDQGGNQLLRHAIMIKSRVSNILIRVLTRVLNRLARPRLNMAQYYDTMTISIARIAITISRLVTR